MALTLQGISVPASRVVFAAECFVYEEGVYVATHLNMTLWGTSESAAGSGAFKENEGKVRSPQYHGDALRRGLHFFFLDGHAKLVFPEGNDFRKPPVCGNSDNDGYFYDVRQFDQIKRGRPVTPPYQ